MKKRTLNPDDSQVATVTKKSKLKEMIDVQLDRNNTSNGDNDFTITTSDSLYRLLDFSHLSDEQEITARFDVLAKALLYHFHLVLKRGDAETEFQILELEFYLKKDECHEDPYTFGTEEQKISGRWHFHRPPRRSADSNCNPTSLTPNYRGGSRKGLDLTIGGPAPSVTITSAYFAPSFPASSVPGPSNLATNQEKQTPLPRGGILLRSIRKLGANSQVISGPSVLVDHILLLSGAASISELVETKWAGDTSAFLPNVILGTGTPSVKLYLKHSTSTTQPESHTTGAIIFNSPRIGLDLSHPGITGPEVKPLHSRIRFLPKRYRYFTHPSKLIANGRTQTFLGVLYSSISSDIDEGLKDREVLAEVVRLSGMREGTVTKYLADYVVGRAGGARMLEGFVGPKGKGAASSPSTYLKMMGAISVL